ncbi:galactokinase [Georgenia sp. Z1344]|uniref:galactokinase n=1 Tax=Georgenia sp. Z1344 TaxID=3416706 RepID=UPI003CE8CD8A
MSDGTGATGSSSTGLSATGLRDAFAATFGHAPTGVWSAPGRVNLVGEHTDYNGGASLPFAIDRRARVAVALREDGVVRAGTSFSPDSVTFDLGGLASGSERPTGWGAYALGVVWALGEVRPLDGLSGFDAWIDSTVPVGVGVSSSAAVEAAMCVALDELWGLGLDRQTMVRVCQRAENVVAGAPTGTLDQSAALLTRPGAGILLDFGRGTVSQVPLDLDDAGLAILVVDSTVRHDHATSGYGTRRAECERAARIAGVEHLAEVAPGEVAGWSGRMPDVELRRMRHVVTDTARCHEVARLLAAGEPRAVGPVLTEAHASLRDDFEVSVPAIDAAVDAAVAAGAHGARLTGGGFGGASIALVDAADAERIAAEVTDAVEGAGFPRPDIFPVLPSGGARRDDDERPG